MDGNNIVNPAGTPLKVLRGSCVIYLAYDFAREVDVEYAAKELKAEVMRPQLAEARPQSKYFGYDPRPARFVRKSELHKFGTYVTEPEVACTVWDFGGITLAFRIQLQGAAFAELVELSAILDESQILEEEGRSIVQSTLGELRRSVKSPNFDDSVEDYVVFHVAQFDRPLSARELYNQEGPAIARLVRGEKVRLSAGVIEETLKYRCSYKADERTGDDSDVTVIGWNSALVYEPDAAAVEDIGAVFEFTLAHLLEMRLLDEKLDSYLDDAYRVSLRRGRWFNANFSQVGLLQVDAAMLFEAVNNALKLVGDEYLAEVHNLAAERFGFAELHRTIRRKLETLQEIYQKLADRRSHRRAEIMELTVILLIALEIVLRLLDA
ncbi:MAG: hypothetical protein U0136_16520 [Bdellovibrionota bacterium]